MSGGRLVGASYETARRYDDKIDTHVALNLTQRFTPKTAGFLAFGVTPAADFLPTWRAKAGVEHELRPGNGRLGGTVGAADMTLADYDAGLARTLGLGLTQYTADGASWGTVRLTGGFDPEGRLDFGASLRLDHRSTTATGSILAWRARATPSGTAPSTAIRSSPATGAT